MIPVILAGGVGSRLWPLSRGMYPKQLLPLVHDEQSMLQQTLLRASSLPAMEPAIIVCNEQHRFIVAEQVQSINQAAVIMLEPTARNTAPAIALAALQAVIGGDDPLLLVMPADHVITQPDDFALAVGNARDLAIQGKLVTFGIVPSQPETGYGYIKVGEPLGSGYAVQEFKEKPDKTVARQYLDDGGYFWNGGIFMFQAEAFLSELKACAPAVLDAATEAMKGSQGDLDFLRIDADSFAQSPSISIDYALMEKSNHVAMVPLDAGWSDVGSWSALWEISAKDADGNATQGDVLAIDTKGSHIYSESKLIATVGLQDLVVVQTDDAVLVADRNRSQDVNAVVDRLGQQVRSQIDHHRKVYRPWGWYDSIDVGDGFQVKRICVKPGAKLSVQMHHHRAEHWVVVKGVAEVLNGDKTFELTENQSTYIPIGATHALKNPSDSMVLEIIEVQSGSYLGEDDIVRFDDQYGRAGTVD